MRRRDIDQCARFTAIFDDSNSGVISQRDFVNFARFLVVMTYLQTEDGQSTVQLARDVEEGRVESPVASKSATMPPSPQAVAHLTVDMDFYQQKCDKLDRE